MRPKKLSLSDKFGILISDLDTYFLEVGAHALLIAATKGSFRDKKISYFEGFFSKSKMEECDQKRLKCLW